MKANAPEKIWVHELSAKELNVPLKEYHVEYIREDAFIKKSCDFFEENIEEENCKIGTSEWTELKAEYKSLDSFIRAFVKYMKGE